MPQPSADFIWSDHFFTATGLEFEKDMIDNYRHARTTFNQSAHIRF
ncbi:hypothetical protein JWG42_16310 [Desulfoprunum benzoelyticum]|uniref:Uncharacterized protein n=1 Tax=Desulfoprunum benzoelyticum TaxID=1506996 RepID=A0A840UVC5_9BACT|nr:hypothetical protein [Desulfoprunum benzoelyticum]MBB5349655.1 hypothetical protein [Desulfoprunum benzoelyticum]MBM9531722.1 hypothetical protein [Desulfoprunum benzoelyticum]